MFGSVSAVFDGVGGGVAVDVVGGVGSVAVVIFVFHEM